MEKIKSDVEDSFTANQSDKLPLYGNEQFCGKAISGKTAKTGVEIYESSEVIDKIKKSEKHFFEYFIGLW